jgi:tRNA G26 N,N-dimethylase Trm1
MTVEIFKTNVKSRKQAIALLRLLNHNLPLAEANFDLEDCDRILRIKAGNINPPQVVHLLEAKGFECCRLE